MTPEQVAALLGALAGLGGLAVAGYRARGDREVGISGDEREARRDEAMDRRDTIADRDSLIASMATRLTAVEQRVRDLDDDLRAERDYTLLLKEHIWRGAPPPPPDRPPVRTG